MLDYMDKFFEDCLKDFDVPDGWVNVVINDVCLAFIIKAIKYSLIILTLRRGRLKTRLGLLS